MQLFKSDMGEAKQVNEKVYMTQASNVGNRSFLRPVSYQVMYSTKPLSFSLVIYHKQMLHLCGSGKCQQYTPTQTECV